MDEKNTINLIDLNTIKILSHNNFDELIDNVYQTHNLLQQNAQKTINLNLTVRNWLIGCYIVEFEQKGEDRAKYGTRLLEEMAKKIKDKGIKGLNNRALQNCRLFYVYYPQIRRSVTAKLQEIEFEDVKLTSDDFQIRRTVSAKLQEKIPIQIQSTKTLESQNNENKSNIIWMQLFLSVIV